MIINRKKIMFFCFVAIAASIALILVLFLTERIASDGWYLNFLGRPKSQSSGHLTKPQEVRGIYMTAYTAGTSRLDELIKFIKDNGLNAAVVDVKGPNGEPAFIFKNDILQKYNPAKKLYDVGAVIKKLHDNGIYAIARVFVFQDPYMVSREPNFALKRKGGGLWADYKGVKWMDPTHFGVWQYNATIMREAYNAGFDEVQFDYIRFPSDGNLDSIVYAKWDGKTPKELEIEKFFMYIARVARLHKIPISADLFGLVCCIDNYDLGIGQVLERTLPYFDFISPMMYPSHYSSGFVGKANPAAYPYEVVKYSIQKANEKIARFAASSTASLAKLRPWIQDFDIGAEYDAEKVMAQARAAREGGAEGFLIWNARNVYTELE